jgi:hypothetical protein
MTVSTVLLSHNCEEEMGSFDNGDIFLVRAQVVVQFLVTNRIHIICDNSRDCQHEFED